MKTTIDKSFQLDEPIDKVWAYLSDPSKIVTCVPGASITEKTDDTHYKGQVTATFGPVKAHYNGEIAITEMDHQNHKMVLSGTGEDARGKGSAEMVMTGTLTPAGNATAVSLIMEITIDGMLAQFGARLIKDVSDQIAGQFINNFKNALAGKDVDNTMKGSSMVGTVLKSTIGGIFGGKEEKGNS